MGAQMKVAHKLVSTETMSHGELSRLLEGGLAASGLKATTRQVEEMVNAIMKVSTTNRVGSDSVGVEEVLLCYGSFSLQPPPGRRCGGRRGHYSVHSHRGTAPQVQPGSQ